MLLHPCFQDQQPPDLLVEPPPLRFASESAREAAWSDPAFTLQHRCRPASSRAWRSSAPPAIVRPERRIPLAAAARFRGSGSCRRFCEVPLSARRPAGELSGDKCGGEFPDFLIEEGRPRFDSVVHGRAIHLWHELAGEMNLAVRLENVTEQAPRRTTGSRDVAQPVVPTQALVPECGAAGNRADRRADVSTGLARRWSSA